MLKPLWRETSPDYPTAELPDHVDVAVVGAGLTGLITAHLLADAGRSVAVLEARHVGAGASGASTAKTTLLQGDRLSTLEKTQDRTLAADYLTASRFGFEWLGRFCREHQVPTQTTSAFTFASDESGVDKVHAEHELARDLGLETQLHASLPTPFAVHAAVELADQLQLNPAELLSALARQVPVIEHTRVTAITAEQDPTLVRLKTTAGELTADQVVLATATPILDHGRTTMELVPQRSYLCSFDLSDTDLQVPEGMFLDVGSAGISLRTATVAGREHLLVGGQGHRTGESHSNLADLAALQDWTAEHFPGAEHTHSWSAQDFHPVSLVPVVKTLPWGEDLVHFAGGYSKWGLTGAPAAARAVADLVLKQKPQVSFGDPGILGTVREAASLQARAIPDTLGNLTEPERHLCSHMGGFLAWNDAEQSWDCPLHGSRFCADGTLLEGPAVDDIDIS